MFSDLRVRLLLREYGKYFGRSIVVAERRCAVLFEVQMADLCISVAAFSPDE